MLVVGTEQIDTYPRESVELVYFNPVTVNGAEVADFTYQLTLAAARPVGSWSAPVLVDAKLALLLPGNLEPGYYTVWVKVERNPEHVLIKAGTINID